VLQREAFLELGLAVKIRLVFISAALLMNSVTNASNVKIYDAKRNFGILIEGDIGPDTLDKFVNVLTELGSRTVVVHLRSNGGRVHEALQIGILSRKLKLSTSVPSFNANGIPDCSGESLTDPTNCFCGSSCFLIHAAGVHRSGEVIGLHRTYLHHDLLKTMSGDEAASASNALKVDVTKYLKSMGIAEEIIARMFSVKSENMEMLEPVYIEKYFSGFIEEYQEWIFAKCGPWRKALERVKIRRDEILAGHGKGEVADLAFLEKEKPTIENGRACEYKERFNLSKIAFDEFYRSINPDKLKVAKKTETKPDLALNPYDQIIKEMDANPNITKNSRFKPYVPWWKKWVDYFQSLSN